MMNIASIVPTVSPGLHAAANLPYPPRRRGLNFSLEVQIRQRSN